MAKIYKTTIYYIDADNQIQNKDQFKQEVKNVFERSYLYHIDFIENVKESKEFDWHEDIDINHSSAGKETYENYFNQDGKEGKKNFTFTYEEDALEAKNILHAEDKFLDIAWGQHLHDSIKEKYGAVVDGEAEVIKVIDERSSMCPGVGETSVLANGMIMDYDISQNSDGTYYGFMTVKRLV